MSKKMWRRALTIAAAVALSGCAPVPSGISDSESAAVDASLVQSPTASIGEALDLSLGSAQGRLPGSRSIELPAEIAGDVYQLAYDAPRNALWFAVMQISRDDSLYRFDLASGELDGWLLPETEHNGFGAQLAIAEDGTVWLTEEYRLVRVDPASGEVRDLLFELDVEGVDRRSEGTYLTALAVSGDEAIAARHQVPRLYRVTALMEITEELAIPEEHAGATGLSALDDGGYVLAGGRTLDVTAVDSEGQVRASIEAAGMNLATGAGLVVAFGPGMPGLIVASDGTSAPLLDESDPLTIWAAAVGPQGMIAAWDADGSRLLRIAADGAVESQPLPVTAGCVFPPGPMPGPGATSDPDDGCSGEQVPARTTPQISALAVDGDGVVWYVARGYPHLMFTAFGD